MAILITSMMFGLLTVPPLAIMPNISAQSTTAAQLSTQIEPQPTANGCYHWTKTKGWQKASCIPEEEFVKHPLDVPTEGGSPTSNQVYGVQTTGTKPTWGQVDVKFTQYSGEYDSLKGTSNTWSIQTNTNTWHRSSNNHKMWVQFTEQNQPGGYRAVCIWQFDLTAYPLNPHKRCADNINYSTLSSSFEGFVTGYVISNSSLRSTYCDVTTDACTSVVDTNLYDLGSSWTSISGTILGYGSNTSTLATAVFTHPAQETTTVETSTESNGTIWPSYDSGESNNLIYSSSSTSCTSRTCYMTSSSNN